jgi:hypothetical protein
VPSPVPPVAPLTDISSSWGNAVADGVNELQGDLYDAGGQLAIPWASISGKPATFAPSAHGHTDATTGGPVDWSAIAGKPATFAPSAHKTSHLTGGSDALTASGIGGFDRQAAGGGGVGTRIFVGPDTPTGTIAEGDVWVKG